MVWIEIVVPCVRCILPPCHHLRGGVDWNIIEYHFAFAWHRHQLRGGVDWNFLQSTLTPEPIVSPPSRWCGLKSPAAGSPYFVKLSPPSRWCGLKSRWLYHRSFLGSGNHLRGGVDWNRFTHPFWNFGPCHHLRGGVDWNDGSGWMQVGCRLDG